jgi:hypothetical protein
MCSLIFRRQPAESIGAVALTATVLAVLIDLTKHRLEKMLPFLENSPRRCYWPET